MTLTPPRVARTALARSLARRGVGSAEAPSWVCFRGAARPYTLQNHQLPQRETRRRSNHNTVITVLVKHGTHEPRFASTRNALKSWLSSTLLELPTAFLSKDRDRV